MSGIGLPEFADPPVVETVLGVSFLEVPQLTTTQIVRFWSQHLAEDLPTDAERAPYYVPVERFPPEPPGTELSVTFHVEPPPKRFLFSHDNHLVQIQPDWFAYNWRKTRARPAYERYEAGRGQFEGYLNRFRDFLHSDLEAVLRPVQCEVTYVNHIDIPRATAEAGPLGGVLRDVRPIAGRCLPTPHHADFSCRYDMHIDDVRGRLHVSAHTAADDLESDTLRVVLTLTARGAPAPDNDDVLGVLRFLNCGREWVVKGFEDLTTEAMHERWGIRSRGECA